MLGYLQRPEGTLEEALALTEGAPALYTQYLVGEGLCARGASREKCRKEDTAVDVQPGISDVQKGGADMKDVGIKMVQIVSKVETALLKLLEGGAGAAYLRFVNARFSLGECVSSPAYVGHRDC
jgi:hypothetical protein